MNQIARYDWLPEGARCGAILPARDYTLGIKLPRKPYNKSFIEKVCSVKMDGYWPRSFLANLWASTSSRSINMQKKELGQYPAILTPHLVNNPYIFIGLTVFNSVDLGVLQWCSWPLFGLRL